VRVEATHQSAVECWGKAAQTQAQAGKQAKGARASASAPSGEGAPTGKNKPIEKEASKIKELQECLRNEPRQMIIDAQTYT